MHFFSFSCKIKCKSFIYLDTKKTVFFKHVSVVDCWHVNNMVRWFMYWPSLDANFFCKSCIPSNFLKAAFHKFYLVHSWIFFSKWWKLSPQYSFSRNWFDSSFFFMWRASLNIWVFYLFIYLFIYLFVYLFIYLLIVYFGL